jgi:RND family efflux transporter MFP subunit
MKQIAYGAVVVTIVAGIGSSLWIWNTRADAQEFPAEATQTEVPVFVPLHIAEASNGLNARTFIGRVEAQRTVDIAFQVGGQVIDISPSEGERVAAGTVIATLDDTDFRLALDRAEAVVELARSEEARVTELVDRAVAPTAQLERARAELRQAEVALSQARRALDQTVIVAPFDANVARRLIETYANVSPTAPVLRLQDVSTLLVAISLPEDLAVLARTAPDDFEATARFPGIPGTILSLDLARFVTEVDPVAQTYSVKLALRDPDPRILPGMTATVTIRPRQSATAVMVPVSAIDTTSAPKPRVWAVDGEGRAHAREVELGLPQGDLIPVLTGLISGERIVSAGWWQMRDGTLVHPATF